MQHFSTLHTDTWVHKKSKHEIQGLAILIIIILVLDWRICPFLRFFTFYVLLCSKKLSVHWWILLIKDTWDKTLEDAMTHAIHKISFLSIFDIYLDSLENPNLV